MSKEEMGSGAQGAERRPGAPDVEIRTLVLRELQRIAPEADIEALDPDSDVRDELDIDSMDVLRFVTALNTELGVSVPESDYRRIITVRGCTEYLAEKLGQPAA